MRYQSTLKAILDEIDRSEREVIARIGVKHDEGKRVVRKAEDERWRWIVRHSQGTAFRGITKADLLLGRES